MAPDPGRTSLKFLPSQRPGFWLAGPRIFDGIGPVRLQLTSSTTFASGMVRLAYRPAPDRQDGASG